MWLYETILYEIMWAYETILSLKLSYREYIAGCFKCRDYGDISLKNHHDLSRLIVTMNLGIYSSHKFSRRCHDVVAKNLSLKT